MPSADVENEEDDEVFHEAEEADQIEPPQVIEDPAQPNNNAEIGRVQLRDRKIIKKPSRYEVNIAECDEPLTIQEAMLTSNADEWKKAIQEELEAHKANGTWTFVPADERLEPIDSKWVFKIKRSTTGKALRYKVRLCFLQQPGRDYLETFAPVVRYDSIRVFLAIVRT